MKISDMLSAVDVIRPSSPDKARLLRALAQHAGERLGIDTAALGRALADREALGSTGVGRGVALPHTRLGAIRQPYGLFAILGKPIEFGAVDDRPVDLVFLLLLSDHAPEDQLRSLACVARRLKEPGLPDRIRAESRSERVYDLLIGD